MTLSLITIAASHYCEKARWGLQRCGVAFREEAHAPMLAWAATLAHGGGRTVPCLSTGKRTLRDSTDILQFADRHKPGALYPDDLSTRAAVDELEEIYDEKLGPHTRRIVYEHLLAEPRVAVPLLTINVPEKEARVFRLGYPAIRRGMRRGMNVTPQKVEESRARVRKIFDGVEERLSDGRRFLTGNAFTAADLTFASLAAILLEPPEYGCPYQGIPGWPQGLKDEVARFREHPAGQFALRIYKEHRSEVVAR